MKKKNTFFLLFSRILAFKIRVLLRLRYKVVVSGIELLQNEKTSLLLPNHQALIDPFLLLSEVFKHSSAIPVISAKYYDIPVASTYFKSMGAVRVSDLETGSRDTQVLKNITRSVYKALKRETNIVIYPSGQLSNQGYEKILNKKSAYHIVISMPETTQIIGVRIRGLWGSIFSKANTGRSPNIFKQLLKGAFFVIANFIFFVPKRKVEIEFFDITCNAIENAKAGLKQFNLFLEEFYNQKGVEPCVRLKHFFYAKIMINRILK